MRSRGRGGRARVLGTLVLLAVGCGGARPAHETSPAAAPAPPSQPPSVSSPPVAPALSEAAPDPIAPDPIATRAALPGSALPGSALPGSALPGSALPGAALPWPTGATLRYVPIEPRPFGDARVFFVDASDGAPVVGGVEGGFVTLSVDGVARRLACEHARVSLELGGVTRDAIVYPATEGLVALGLADGAVRWLREDLRGRDTPLVSDEVVLVSTSDQTLGLDAGTGRTLWARPRVAPYARAGEGLLVWGDEAGVTAIALASGEERFHLAVRGVVPTTISPSGFGLVASRIVRTRPSPRALTLVSLEGAITARLRLDADLVSADGILLDDASVTAIVGVGDRRASVRRYDRRTGRRRASSPPIPTTLSRTALRRGGDRLLFADGTTGARILDDALVPRWLVDDCGGGARFWVPTPGAAPLLLCGGALWRVDELAPPRHRVIVSGVVRSRGHEMPGATLSIEGVLVDSGPGGRYRAEVDSDAVLHVSSHQDFVDFGSTCWGSRSLALTPDQSEVTLDVEVECQSVALGL